MSLRFAIISASLLVSSILQAQSPEYGMVLESNPQLQSSVAAAMSDFSHANMSWASASFSKDNGEYIGIDGSSDSWMAKSEAESFTRISDRIVFFGGLSYSYFRGENMSGSLLRDMYYNPVAFLEPTSEYAGVKTRELYSLAGAMSYSISDKWSAGIGLEYESGNNVKTKDPRYRSEWSYLNLSASFWYRKNDRFATGASLIYRNTQEMLKSGIYGTTDKTYLFAVDRGGFLGTASNVDSDNDFISKSSFIPMRNHFMGGSYQLISGKYHTDLVALYRTGKYGRDTSFEPVFFDYGGVDLSWGNSLIIPKGSSLHSLFLNAGFKMLKNTENSVTYSTVAGGNTTVQYAGAMDVLNRKDITASLGYNGSLGINEGKPSIRFGAQMDVDSRIQKTTIYPFYRNHNRNSLVANLSADKYLYGKKGMLCIGASALGGAGFGTAAKDGSYANTTGGKLQSFDNLLNRQFEYETAPFAGASLRLSYTRHISKGTDAFVALSDKFTSLLKNPEYLGGRTRNAAVISVGLNF